MIKDFFKQHNIEYNEDISLRKYNTYRLNTIAQYLVFPKDEDELISLLDFIKKNNIKYVLLGNGSNVIFRSTIYDGIVIKLDHFNDIVYHDNIVTIGAGYSLIKLAMDATNKGLSGLTFAAGIPGAVGASTAMNAGAYNSDLSNIIKSVKVITPDLQVKTMNKEELSFGYRDSFLKQNPGYIVISTTFELEYGDIEEMKSQIEERRQKRLLAQPLDMPSAGSVFRNPPNMHAGELIEKCNLKGYNINGAEVSKKHANFIVNTGNATGEDIIKLITLVKKEVKEKYNVDLVLEQIIIE